MCIRAAVSEPVCACVFMCTWRAEWFETCCLCAAQACNICETCRVTRTHRHRHMHLHVAGTEYVFDMCMNKLSARLVAYIITCINLWGKQIQAHSVDRQTRQMYTT